MTLERTGPLREAGAMTQTTWPEPPPPQEGPPVGRIVLTVAGALIIAISLGLGAVGSVITWAYATQRDSQGFFTTSTKHFETLSYAITSENIDLGVQPGRDGSHFDLGNIATVRLRVAAPGGAPVFVGIGRERDVDRYLANVAHAEIADVGLHPFRVTYRLQSGSAPSTLPGNQRFWAASAQGPGVQHLQGDLESGRWAVVVMNADGSRGVGADASVGVKSDWVLPVGLGLLGGFGLLAILGTVLLVLGAAGLGRRVSAPMIAGPHPVRVSGRFDPQLSRWLWIV
jgi:hypothetical protein